MWLSLVPLLHAEPVVLTASEVARHDTAADCWLILEGQVYDLTTFLPSHPGGDALLRGCGKDATWFWNNRAAQGDGHSESAEALLVSYRLGALDETTDVDLPEGPHPHDLRLEGSQAGLFPTAGVGPRRSVALRVGHSLSTDDAVPTGLALGLGYSFGRVDVLLSDYRAQGYGNLQLKGAALSQDLGHPVSLSVGLGGGFSSVAEAPVLFSQAVVERELLDRRLALRGNGTGALSPGVDDSAALSLGAGLEFRPIPIHSVFGEVQVPLEDPSALLWSAGLRLFTRGHTFSLFVANTPSLSPAVLAGPAPRAIAVGGAFERAFRL